jgi:hypothetical protein
MARSSTSFGPRNNANPSGRPARKPDERAAEDFLRDRTLAAAQRLVQLQASDDEKVALGAVQCHLKLAIGEISRVAGADGKTLLVELVKRIASAPAEQREAIEAELERRAK